MGTGAGNIIIDAQGIDRAFHVKQDPVTFLSAGLTIDGVTVTGGDASLGVLSQVGGGIYNEFSTLTISNSVVSGNTAYDGGGISAFLATATNISDSTISQNTASNPTPFSFSRGGGLYDFLGTFADNLVSTNLAQGGDGLDAGPFQLAGSGGDGCGGGIFSFAETVFSFTTSTISDNQSIGGSGGDSVDPYTVAGNGGIGSGGASAATAIPGSSWATRRLPTTTRWAAPVAARTSAGSVGTPEAAACSVT